MGQRTAASRRKQQGRENKRSGAPKGAVPVLGPSSGGGGKEGIPAFFKHRKYAAQAAASREQNEAHGEELDMDEAGASSTLADEAAAAAAAAQAPPTEFQFALRPDHLSQEKDQYSALSVDKALTGAKDSSLRAYSGQLKELISSSDVLLEVLDARDPMACRSLTTETLALGQGKRVILVLNKVDLVPRENVEKWLKFLRHDFTTLAFKASTQQQRAHLAQGAGKVPGTGTGALHTGNEALGATALLQLLKNYSRNFSIKTSLTVGIFGAPNVGKSSLINSLKRARVCGVASTPGHTKALQSVALDKKIRLIDCPGVSFHEPATGRGMTEFDTMAAALRNVVKVELLEDPITPVRAILSRVPLAQLEDVYDLPPSSPLKEHGEVLDATRPIDSPTLLMAQRFLLRLALRRGRLQSATGAPDLEGAARSVLHDWNVGKIKYFTAPPLVHRSALVDPNATTKQATAPAAQKSAEDAARAAIAATSEIKTTLDQEFDLDALFAGLDNPDEALSGAQAEPIAVGNVGRGSVVQGGAALQARERRMATQQDLDRAAGDLIEEDEEEMVVPVPAAAPPAPAHDTTSTSLGKRRRDLDDSDDDGGGQGEEEEEMVPSYMQTRDFDSDSDDEDLVPSRLLPTRPQAAAREEAEDEMEDDAMVPAPAVAAPQAAGDHLPSWLEKQQRKAAQAGKKQRAELSKRAQLATIFSAEELDGMQLQSKGKARKKARKLARRERKANADGLGDLIEMGMELRDHDQDANLDVYEKGSGQSKYAPGAAGAELNPTIPVAIDEDEEEAEAKAAKAAPKNPFALLNVEGGGGDDDDDDDDDDDVGDVDSKEENTAPAPALVDGDEEL